MKIKTRSIIDAVPALKRLNESELPLVTSYRIYGLVDEVNTVLSFFSKKRDEIQAKERAHDAEIAELLDAEVEIHAEKIKLPSDVRISAADIKSLLPFVEFSLE